MNKLLTFAHSFLTSLLPSPKATKPTIDSYVDDSHGRIRGIRKKLTLLPCSLEVPAVIAAEIPEASQTHRATPMVSPISQLASWA